MNKDANNTTVEEITEDSMKDKYLTFNLATEGYGIEIRYVTEIIGIQQITNLPDMPACIKGVINLRGKVIPVMDVRLRFKMEPRDYDDSTRIIVVEYGGITVGLVVDDVCEVVDIPESKIEPPPGGSKGNSNGYIHGMGKLNDEVKILLDANFLFYGDELAEIARGISEE